MSNNFLENSYVKCGGETSPKFLIKIELSYSLCIAIIWFPVYDAIHFEINLSFLIKLFSYMTKKVRTKKLNILTLYAPNCLSVFDHFVELALKGLRTKKKQLLSFLKGFH